MFFALYMYMYVSLNRLAFINMRGAILGDGLEFKRDFNYRSLYIKKKNSWSLKN